MCPGLSVNHVSHRRCSCADHERMRLTLKEEATKPASFNFLQQQDRFDIFVEVYKNEHPHRALNGQHPGEPYTPSARPYQTSEEPE